MTWRVNSWSICPWIYLLDFGVYNKWLREKKHTSDFVHIFFWGVVVIHFTRQFSAFNGNTAIESAFHKDSLSFSLFASSFFKFNTSDSDVIYIVFFSLISFSCLPVILCGLGLTFHWCFHRSWPLYFPDARWEHGEKSPDTHAHCSMISFRRVQGNWRLA